MGATSSAPAWLTFVESGAPDTVAAWSALGNAFAGVRALRGVLHERVTDGAAPRILAEQEVLAQALADALADVPDAALRMPGGEEEWNGFGNLRERLLIHRQPRRPTLRSQRRHEASRLLGRRDRGSTDH